MLKRSIDSKYSRSTFFKRLNDVNIYIEDTAEGYKKIFLFLLEKLFKDKFKIVEVFPLGSKNDVIKKHKEIKNNADEKNYLFIVDGDLDLLTEEYNLVKSDGLYILPKYCIENFLIEEKAILKILDQESTDLEYAKLSELFNYNSWLANINKDLHRLYLVYGATYSVCPEIETIAFSLNKLTSNDKGHLDPAKITSRIDNIKKKINNKDCIEQYNEAYSQLEAKHECSKKFIKKYVSGKNHLLPLCFIRMKKIVKMNNVKHISLKMRLADEVESKELNDIKDYIHFE